MSQILFTPELSIRYSAIKSVIISPHVTLVDKGKMIYPPHVLINEVHIIECADGLDVLAQLAGCEFYTEEQYQEVKKLYHDFLSKYAKLIGEPEGSDCCNSAPGSHPLLNKHYAFFEGESSAVAINPESVHFDKVIENAIVINPEHSNTNIGWRFWLYENECNIYITGTRFDLWDATEVNEGHWRDLEIDEAQLTEDYDSNLSNIALESLQSYVRYLKSSLGKDLKLSKESAAEFPSLKSILDYDEGH